MRDLSQQNEVPAGWVAVADITQSRQLETEAARPALRFTTDHVRQASGTSRAAQRRITVGYPGAATPADVAIDRSAISCGVKHAFTGQHRSRRVIRRTP